MSGHYDMEDLGAAVFDAMIRQLMPSWAVGFTEDYMTIGAQLCTRDGRLTGNAVVLDSFMRIYKTLSDFDTVLVAEVMTDMGNVMVLTQVELEDLFHTPKYIIDLNDRKVMARLNELREE